MDTYNNKNSGHPMTDRTAALIFAVLLGRQPKDETGRTVMPPMGSGDVREAYEVALNAISGRSPEVEEFVGSTKLPVDGKANPALNDPDKVHGEYENVHGKRNMDELSEDDKLEDANKLTTDKGLVDNRREDVTKLPFKNKDVAKATTPVLPFKPVPPVSFK